MGSIASLVGGVVGLIGGGGSSGAGQEQQMLQQEEQMMQQNFALQTEQGEIDNRNATVSAIAQGHAQTAASTASGQREVSDANAHIVA